MSSSRAAAPPSPGTRAPRRTRRTGASGPPPSCGSAAAPLGEEPGRRWAHGRYSAPYLRDALLDAGAFAETLETATFWSGLPGLYAAVRDALTTTLTEAGTRRW